MNSCRLASFSSLITRTCIASIAIASGVILSTSSPVRAFTLSDTVYWDVVGRDLRISNPRFTSVGSGSFDKNVADVTIDSALSLAFNWAFGEDTSNSSYCPTCIIQNYIAWIQPSQTVNSSSGFVSGVFNGWNSGSGSFSWTTKAPSTAGTYYIGSNFSLQYEFLNNVPGEPGGPTSSGPYGNVVPFKVIVSPAPGPLPLLGMASAFAFSRRLRHRVKAMR